MTRKARWFASTFVVLVVGVVATSVLPEMRLRAELAGAQREGLPTTPQEVRELFGPARPEDDGAELAAGAIENEYREQARQGYQAMRDVNDARYRLLNNIAREGDREALRRWLDRSPLLAEDWREVAQAPAIAFLMDEIPVTVPEYRPIWSMPAGPSMLELGVRRLLTEAALGRSPRENLVAAARLLGGAKQDVGTVGALTTYEQAEKLLRLARKWKVGAQARKALGPPPDVRRVLASELPTLLRRIDRVRRPNPRTDSRSWTERFRQSSFLAAITKIRVVRAWRTLWRELPADPHDYAGAAAVIERRLPEISRALAPYSPQLSPGTRPVQELRAALLSFARRERDLQP